MLTKRMIEIFQCIVEEFVQTAEPVGSKTLMKKYNLPYSSATIRNEMMSLEELGYLEKTHTSSGRIPSIKGYQFYCEHLMKNEIDDHVEYALANFLDKNQMNLDETIKASCDVLSKMTNLATGVLGPDASEQVLNDIKLFPIDSRSAVCVFITNTGHTENKVFQFDSDVSLEDVRNCCDILNDRLKGTRINEVVEKMQAIKPILKEHVKKHELLFNAFVRAFIKFASDNIYFSGKSNMLYQPEFADIEKLKSFMNLLENSGVWRNIDNVDNKVTVNTSSGSTLTWVDDVAVISSKFKVNDEEGQFMVVGPPRMDYDKVVGMLEYISSSIERMYKGDKDEQK